MVASSSSENAPLHDVALRPHLDLVVQQLSQQLDGEVPLRQLAHLGEELVREQRDVGLLQAGRRKDVDHLSGGDRSRDDLADHVIEIFLGPSAPNLGLYQRRLHGLEERNLVADGEYLRA